MAAPAPPPPEPPPPPAAAEEVRRLALEAGFDRAGFARAGRPPHAERFERWLEAGRAGSMAYLARTAAKRTDPARVLPGVRSVIALALHYGMPEEPRRSSRSAGETAAVAARGRGEVSRYARGTDYHGVIEARLRRLCSALHARWPAEQFRWYVDTGPVIERSWAEAAGIGWIGKNACAIDPERGSYFFIAVVLTTLDLPAASPIADHCGSCRLCIDACPTAAIVGPRELDARRCISYLTIEHRGAIDESLRPALGGLVFGCDICQEVCPFNRPDRLAGDPDLAPRPQNLEPSLTDLAALGREGFAARFPKSAVRRARAAGFLRNVLIAIGNSGRAELLPRLEEIARRKEVAGDPILRETLAWARGRLAYGSGG